MKQKTAILALYNNYKRQRILHFFFLKKKEMQQALKGKKTYFFPVFCEAKNSKLFFDFQQAKKKKGTKSSIYPNQIIYAPQKSFGEHKRFGKAYSKISEVKLITIGLASPERIRQWAEKTLPNGKIIGQVINANTLHHKTFKPQKGGLFCERIFGPLKDFECACGKTQKPSKNLKGAYNYYKEQKTFPYSSLALGFKKEGLFFLKEKAKIGFLQKIESGQIVDLPRENNNDKRAPDKKKGKQKYWGTFHPEMRKFCPDCDVEYTWSVIRRYQLGYIQLISPVTHVWYVKGNPSYISILLDIKKRHLEYVTYCSETLTLENSLKGETSFLLGSPSQIFASWEKLMKDLFDYSGALYNNLKRAPDQTFGPNNDFGKNLSPNHDLVAPKTKSTNKNEARAQKFAKQIFLKQALKNNDLHAPDSKHLTSWKEIFSTPRLFFKKIVKKQFGPNNGASPENKNRGAFVSSNYLPFFFETKGKNLKASKKVQRAQIIQKSARPTTNLGQIVDLPRANKNDKRAPQKNRMSKANFAPKFAKNYLSQRRKGAIFLKTPKKFELKRRSAGASNNFKAPGNHLFGFCEAKTFPLFQFFAKQKTASQENKKQSFSLLAGPKEALHFEEMQEGQEKKCKARALNFLVFAKNNYLTKNQKNASLLFERAQALKQENIWKKKLFSLVFENLVVFAKKQIEQKNRFRPKFKNEPISFFKLPENKKEMQQASFLFSGKEKKRASTPYNNSKLALKQDDSSSNCSENNAYSVQRTEEEAFLLFSKNKKIFAKKKEWYRTVKLTKKFKFLLSIFLTAKRTHSAFLNSFLPSSTCKTSNSYLFLPFLHFEEMQQASFLFSGKKEEVSNLQALKISARKRAQDKELGPANQNYKRAPKSLKIWPYSKSTVSQYIGTHESKIFLKKLPIPFYILITLEIFNQKKSMILACEKGWQNLYKNAYQKAILKTTQTLNKIESFYINSLFFAGTQKNFGASAFVSSSSISSKSYKASSVRRTKETIPLNLQQAFFDLPFLLLQGRETEGKIERIRKCKNKTKKIYAANLNNLLQILKQYFKNHLLHRIKKSLIHRESNISRLCFSAFKKLALGFEKKGQKKKDSRGFFFAGFGARFFDLPFFFETKGKINKGEKIISTSNALDEPILSINYSTLSGICMNTVQNFLADTLLTYLLEDTEIIIKLLTNVLLKPLIILQIFSLFVESRPLMLAPNIYLSPKPFFASFGPASKEKLKISVRKLFLFHKSYSVRRTEEFKARADRDFAGRKPKSFIWRACAQIMQKKMARPYKKNKKEMQQASFLFSGKKNKLLDFQNKIEDFFSKPVFAFFSCLKKKPYNYYLAKNTKLKNQKLKKSNYLEGETANNINILETPTILIPQKIYEARANNYYKNAKKNLLKRYLLYWGREQSIVLKNVLKKNDKAHTYHSYLRAANLRFFTHSVQRTEEPNEQRFGTSILLALKMFSINKLLNGKKPLFITQKNFLGAAKSFKKSQTINLNKDFCSQAQLMSPKNWPRLVNNIYCLSHRERWEVEKDWQYFLLYISAPAEFIDLPIPSYNYRFSSGFSQNLASTNLFTNQQFELAPKKFFEPVQNNAKKISSNISSSVFASSFFVLRMQNKKNNLQKLSLSFSETLKNLPWKGNKKTEKEAKNSNPVFKSPEKRLLREENAKKLNALKQEKNNDFFGQILRDLLFFLQKTKSPSCISSKCNKPFFDFQAFYEKRAPFLALPEAFFDFALGFKKEEKAKTGKEKIIIWQDNLQNTQKDWPILVLGDPNFLQKNLAYNNYVPLLPPKFLVEARAHNYYKQDFFVDLAKKDEAKKSKTRSRGIELTPLFYNSNNLNVNAFYSGPGIIQQLLHEFDFYELKKMDKQNRILLYQLNKQIFKLKKRFFDRSAKKELKECYKKRDLLIRRTKLVRKLFRKDSDPNSMVLTILPVLPPDLRPIVKIGGQVAASDLNRLYQRVIYRNDRLKKFLKDPATAYSYEMKYAQRLLQEAVDNLIQNGKSGVVAEKDSRGRALKSLSDILKGKQGRFRQYLLGKRVDYSGRSVIVVGPKLKLHECGIPKEMALELYLPFLLKRILHQNLARTVIGAKTLIKTNPDLTWELLREIMQVCPVLLNRAPTLHRLGFQAFQPKLIDGRAILLHPLVCPAFNADFDGDQMAVHVPITVEARAEAWKLMLSRNNLLAPATGEPLAIPSQDMVLGCYYLTTNCNKNTLLYQKGFGFYFNNFSEVIKAYDMQKIDLHSIIWVKWNSALRIENGNDQEEPIELRLTSNGNWQEIYSVSQKSYANIKTKNVLMTQYISTTPGKILFNLIVQNTCRND